MAKKKEAQTVADANAVSGTPGASEEVEFTKEEQTANEVLKAESKGDAYGGKFKLSDPDTQYADPDFSLAGDQEKELPKNPSPELIARIRTGFIVKA